MVSARPSHPSGGKWISSMGKDSNKNLDANSYCMNFAAARLNLAAAVGRVVSALSSCSNTMTFGVLRILGTRSNWLGVSWPGGLGVTGGPRPG